MIIFDDRLYPYSMLKAMPVGLPKNVYKEMKDFFGIDYYNIIAPKGMNVPFLPFRQQNNDNSTSQVFPIGQWSGWYFSEEIKYARQQGYKYEKSYDQFTNYVTLLSKIMLKILYFV